MMKKYWKLLVITSIIIILPIVAGLLFWDQLPDRVPIHWNVAGEVDGWSGKPFAVFGLPLIMLAVQWLCCLVTAADPKKANHGDKVIQLVLWILPVMTVALSMVTYSTAFGKPIPMEVVMPLLTGLLFAVIGNYLPKCKQNYTIGIKLPWTLNSEENWNKTHRLAGGIWLVCGLLIMLSGILGFFWSGTFWVMLGMTPVMVFVPVGYSYGLHRKGV